MRNMKQSTAMKLAMKASLEDISSSARMTQVVLSPSIFPSMESVAEALTSLDKDFFDAHDVVARPTIGRCVTAKQ